MQPAPVLHSPTRMSQDRQLHISHPSGPDTAGGSDHASTPDLLLPDPGKVQRSALSGSALLYPFIVHLYFSYPALLSAGIYHQFIPL